MRDVKIDIGGPGTGGTQNNVVHVTGDKSVEPRAKNPPETKNDFWMRFLTVLGVLLAIASIGIALAQVG